MDGSLNGYRLRSAHGDVIDPRQPLPVDTVEAQETVSVAPTLTYNGKAAAGAISICALALKPIIEDLGSRVGSHWSQIQNRVYSAYADGNPKKEDSWLLSVTETATAAAITIYDPNKNLEEMFESLTTTVKRFVVKVYDKTGGSLYGWIMGVSVASNVYTFTIHNNRLTETQSWVGTLGDFDNTALEKVEIYFYNSSIAFGTGTTFTEEVECPREYSKNRELQLKYAETLANGQYFVDYWRGELIGVKADTTASEVVTYNVWASTAGGGSSAPTSNINITKVNGDAVVAANTARTTATKVIPTQPIGADGTVPPTGSLLTNAPFAKITDGTSNLTLGTGTVKNVPVGLNDGTTAIVFGTGTTKTVPAQIHDGTTGVSVLARTTGKEKPAITDDALVVYDVAGSAGVSGGGFSTYVLNSAGTFGHGTATYLAAGTITIAGMSFTLDPQAIIKIDRFSSLGVYQETITPNSHTITFAAPTLSVATMSATAGDLYVIYVQGPERTVDNASNLQRTGETNPISQHYVEDNLVNATNVAATIAYYPSAAGMEMAGYNNLSITGKYVDAHAVSTIFEVQGSNSASPSTTEWVPLQGQINGLIDASATPVTPVCTGTVAGTTGVTVVPGTVCTQLVTAVAQTMKFVWDFDNCAYKYIRLAVTPGDASNTLVADSKRFYA